MCLFRCSLSPQNGSGFHSSRVSKMHYKTKVVARECTCQGTAYIYNIIYIYIIYIYTIGHQFNSMYMLQRLCSTFACAIRWSDEQCANGASGPSTDCWCHQMLKRAISRLSSSSGASTRTKRRRLPATMGSPLTLLSLSKVASGSSAKLVTEVAKAAVCESGAEHCSESSLT